MPSTPLFISTFPRLIVALLAVASVAAAAAPATRPAKSRPTTRSATTAPAATQPAATNPATTTTAPAPAPKAVALALTAAIEKGDLPTAQALIVADEPSQKLLAGTIQFARALAKLDAAAVARFGEPGHAVSQNLLRLGESSRALEGATQSIDAAGGDTAVLYSAATGTALVNLRKVDGQWRVILDSPPQGLERTLDLYRRVERLAQRMVAEISSGIYGSPEEAAQAFTKGLWRARLEAQ